ncbi:MAG: hypothetical protein GY821_16645 [Gammaproteobacteria bacterium]|nr:hypothetical protein [Gammaproteobacteria bacterium]
MLKKLAITSLLTLITTTTMAMTGATEQCQTTIAISKYWSGYNITFENESGEAMGLYRANSDKLLITRKHPCEITVSHIIANPTLGGSLTSIQTAYTSNLSYPMGGNIVVSFPDDFNAPEYPPTTNSK